MSNAYIGTTPLVAAYIGTTPVDKLYLGTEQIWPAGAPPTGSTPDDFPNLRGWWDFSDAATITIATGISAITDKSGGGFTMLQPTGSSQPARLAAHLNGKDVARFSGGQLMELISANWITSTQMSVYAVIRKDANDPAGRALSMQSSSSGNDYGDTASTTPLINLGDWPCAYRQGNQLSSASAANLGNWLYVASIYDGTNHTMWINGVAQAPVATAGAFDIDQTVIGSRAFVQGEPLACSIGELFIYTDVRSSTDRTALFDYMADKYGL